mgnify:FL=1|tara:strand:+ start:321 stop:566 length:246 start_codon:yes stop_codon:yes gene_type:complete
MSERAKNRQHVEYEILRHMMENIPLTALRRKMAVKGRNATAAKAGERFDNGADNIAVIIDNLMATRRRFLPESHPDYEVRK